MEPGAASLGKEKKNKKMRGVRERVEKVALHQSTLASAATLNPVLSFTTS